MADNNTKVGVELTADTRSLRTQLREATMELVKLQNTAGATSEEIAKVARRTAELKDRIGDARDTIDAFNPDAKFRSFSTSIQGVAGAFSATQGALALFGSESENLQKQLLKVQGALALSEGINSILGAKDAFANLALVIKTQVVESFATLRGAILTTGLGAMAIALAEGYILWQDYAEGIEKVREKLKKLREDTEKQIKSQRDNEIESLERLRREAIVQAKLKNASEEEIYAIEDKFSRLKVKAKARALGEASADEKLFNELDKDLKNDQLAREERKADQYVKVNEKMRLATEKRLAEEARLQEEADQKWIDSQEKRIARLTDFNKAGKSEFEIRMGILKDQYDLDLEMFKDSEGAKLMAKKWYDDQAIKLIREQREKEIEGNKDYADKRLKDLEKRSEKEQKSREKTEKMIMKSMDTSIAKTQDQTKVDNLNRQIRLQNAEAIGNALGALSGMAEQGSDLQKGLALGQVAVDTAVAISSLTASSEANPANAVTFGGAGISQFATGIIRILANIAQAKSILSQAPGNGGSVSTPSISTSAPVMPQYQAPQATRLDQQSLNTISNVVARAYVVESDITGSQKRIKRIENASKF
jgi:hypothetical protein